MTNIDRYGHLFTEEKAVTITLEHSELCALMQAYDWGLANASEETRKQLDSIINKLATEARG